MPRGRGKVTMNPFNGIERIFMVGLKSRAPVSNPFNGIERSPAV